MFFTGAQTAPANSERDVPGKLTLPERPVFLCWGYEIKYLDS